MAYIMVHSIHLMSRYISKSEVIQATVLVKVKANLCMNINSTMRKA